MRRPWYLYPLLFIGCIALLGALFRPVFGVTSTAPGALLDQEQHLTLRPGGPLARAGVSNGDRFVTGETVEIFKTPDGPATLRWRRGIPRSGNVQVRRNSKDLWFEVRPAPPAWPVRLAWWITGLLNVSLTAMALALFWQRPRDSRAILLGLVLLAAPVFSLPREPRLIPLALAAHFYTLFPGEVVASGRRRWTLLRLYGPLLLAGLLGGALASDGKSRDATAVFDLTAIGYAVYCLVRVSRRWRTADEATRPVVRTLTVAAAAMLAAVIGAVSQRLWVLWDQFVPANLVPAAIFSAAIGHLVFRLRALEVRLMARRTLQYLLTRWTLGTLFLIPGFLLVWRFGQLSVSGAKSNPSEVLGFFVWMFVTAVLLGKRHEVLRNLDRRFFRDVEASRQSLIRLAQELGGETEPDAVLNALESGAREALHPTFLRFALPDVPPESNVELVVPLRRGARILGHLHLGARETGAAYSTEERELLEAAAVQAAMALENARLNSALLARQREELAVRTAGVLAGAEEERGRLAADLHDQVLPELRQIVIDVERLTGQANGLAPDLQRLAQEVRGTMDSVRDVMEALRPSALDMLGLGDALESYFRQAARRCDPPITVVVRRSEEEPKLTPEQSLGLYRICQEAINNVLKHSQAERAGLELGRTGTTFTVGVWDDGKGLPPSAGTGSGHGLRNMNYRADLIGAQVSWQALEPSGTRVEVSLPLSALPEAFQVTNLQID